MSLLIDACKLNCRLLGTLPSISRVKMSVHINICTVRMGFGTLRFTVTDIIAGFDYCVGVVVPELLCFTGLLIGYGGNMSQRRLYSTSVTLMVPS